MAKANKTTETAASVNDFIDQVPDELIVFNYEYAGDRHGVNSVL